MYDPQRMAESRASSSRQLKWIRRGALLLLLPVSYWIGGEVVHYENCRGGNSFQQ